MSEYAFEFTAGVVEFAEKKLIRVLHVDDEESFLSIAKECLQMQGAFEVDTALSAGEAIRKMKEKEYDAIVCDYQMPQKDGLQFLEELRKSGNSIPFILFTGKGREEVAVKALNLGADGYISKNGDPETVYCELAHNIRQAVNKRRAEIRLKMSEAKYRNFFENAYDCIILMDLNGNITDVNSVVLKYGFTKEQLIGRNVTEFVSLKDKMRLIKEIALKREGKSFEGNVEINTPKGKVRAAYRCKPLIIDGRVLGIQAIITDSAKKGETEKFPFDETLDSLLNGVLVVSAKTHKIVYANRYALELIGASKEEVVGKICHRFICPAEKGKCPITDLGQTVDRSERVLLKANGELIPVLKTVAVTTWRGQKYLVESFIDITERKMAEEALRDSAEKYGRLFEESLDAIFVADAETGIIVDCNRAAAELVGRDKSEIIGKHQRILHPSERIKDGFSITFKQHVQGAEDILEDQIITKNGEIKDVAIKASVLEFKGKKLIQGIFRDITKQKRAERALRESEETYRALLNGMNDTAWVIGFDGKFIDVNDAAVRVLGYSREELLNMGPPDIDPSMTKEQIMALIRNMQEKILSQGGDSSCLKDKIPVFETTHVTKDGRAIPVEISSSLVTYKGKPAILSIARDITERKKVEEKLRELTEALKESEATYRALLNGMNDTAWVIGFDGKFIDVNDAAVRVLGYSREELLKMGPPDIDTSLTEEQIKELIRNMPKDKIQVFETTHKTRDGRIIPVEISSSLVTYRGKTAILSIARDITRRKKAEEKMRSLMEQLKMANEKLGVVGKWTRHDARNKLSVIKSNVYLAKKNLPSDHPVIKRLDEIDQACNQIVRIFDFASQYEMLGVENRSYVDVEKSVEEAATLVSSADNIKIVNECSGLMVLADSQLRQLFYNLIDNSLKHGEKVTKIRIYYKEEEDKLKLVYEDDGIGISNEARPNLFKEGYGKGTGYGLYLTAKLCEMYGWTIQETGEYGRGAQFIITVPKTNAKGEPLYKIQR
ncbi:MAG: PAS domain S-box protein [Nitrososphaerota archaeon]|nr:PAS domain S-box protein [Candidatus Bathyarchaeota archaeon]MDW8023896.1 PAS domain S-box protein [Nitrososphaerota archaeon]